MMDTSTLTFLLVGVELALRDAGLPADTLEAFVALEAAARASVVAFIRSPAVEPSLSSSWLSELPSSLSWTSTSSSSCCCCCVCRSSETSMDMSDTFRESGT